MGDGVIRTSDYGYASRATQPRQNSWELLRERLKNVMKPEGPRLFVFSHCRQFIPTVLVLPRDEIDMDTALKGRLGFGLRDERKRSVPQPLVTSLSLRSTKYWNHD